MTPFSADSHPGHKRSHNEDCFEASPDGSLWLVADGVGGHANGEVASAIVRDTLVSDSKKGVELVQSIRNAHDEILREIARRPACNMGSTVVALRLQDKKYEVAWVGDSRAYLFNGEQLRQITRDHNPVSELVARGVITPEQAAHHPERNVLSQSLGVSDAIKVDPERVRGELQRGEQFLLCSDGLSDEVPDDYIRQILRENDSPESQVNALVKAALDAGGRDNVTVIVVGEKARSAPAGRADSQTTLEGERAVQAEAIERSNDRLAWLVLAGLAGLALLWVLLKS